MFFPGKHAKTDVPCINDELMQIEGTLSEDEAKITFARFLKANPTFAAQLLLGVELYPFQHLLLKAIEKKDFGMFILSRGFGKSWSSAVAIALYAIFNPGLKIGILAPSWRQSKFIFKQIEDFSKSPGGAHFKQCLGRIGKGPDAWDMEIGSSKVFSIPLGDGGRIRGYRFNLIFIDEGLLLSETVVNEVIRPFLNVNFDPRARQHYKDATDQLLQEGKITQIDIDRYAYPNQKLMVLSSASYTFEYLYKMMKSYIDKIEDAEDKNNFSIEGKSTSNVSHVVFQMSYKMAPTGLLSTANIEEGKRSMSAAQFGREYEARFTDDSASFFSPRRMREATFLTGEGPGTRIYGDPKKEYILAIDPNYSDSETSDHFAMCVLEVDKDTRTSVMVHGYALSKSNITARADYVKYLIRSFNIVYVIVDNAGGDKFIRDINEMSSFTEEKLEISFFEEDFDNSNYIEGVKNSKKAYDKSTNRICHARVFNSEWIRTANEHLQACLENKKLLFASEGLTEGDFDAQKSSKIPIENLHFDKFEDEDKHASLNEKLVEFIERQSFIIQLTKEECSLIEVSSSAQGRQVFDLPKNLKNLTTPDRPRKDSYSALLLANYGAKCYFDMMDFKQERNSFIPINF